MELIPVDHDPFASNVAAGGSPLRITVNPSGARLPSPQMIPVDHDPFAKVGYGEDAAKTIPPALARGAAGLAGLPGDVGVGVEWAMNWLEQTARQEGDTDFAKRVAERKAKLMQARRETGIPDLGPPTSKTIRGAIEGVTGKLYEPQTTPGKYVNAMGELAPIALAGPGGIVRKLVNFAAVPGVTSETAGELMAGTPLETPARIVGGLIGGVGASVLNQPRTAERVIRGAMSPQVDRAAIDRATQLMDDAAGRGIQITWAEALEQVAPGAGLTNTQRLVESTPGGRETLGPIMAQRPQQIDAAARQTFDTMAPPNRAPSTIGPAVGEAAEGSINDTRQRINSVAQPFYDRASTVRLTPAEMRSVRALPGYEEARSAVRNDPQLNRYVSGLPDDSVGFLNEVKKYLDNAATNAGAPVNAQRNMQRSAGYGRDATAVRDAGTNAYFGNPARNYETALNIESQGRERFLQPLLDGPLGKIAAKDTTTKNAIDALFPANPLPNSEREISRAVRELARRNQPATRDLVRAHAESTFNEAAQNLQGGANQFGGAKFAALIAGNPQQRRNLEAAVRASGPNGDQVWNGFNRFLDVVEATGKRQPIGSKTAFNTQELKDLSTGGMVGNAVKTGASPAKWVSVISDAWGRWQLGNNVDQLARILVDPQSRNLLRAIASRPVGGEAQIIAGRLALLANQSREGGSNGQK